MKTVLSILLAITLLLSIAGCVQNPSVTTVTPENNNASTTIDATTSSAVLDIDLAGNWVKPDVYWSERGSLSDLGYYHFSDTGLLTFTDTTNAISVTLCHKTACSHSGKDLECCEATALATQFFFYHEGYIYFDKYIVENPYAVHLFRRKADGTGEEKVAVLGEAYFSANTSVSVGQCLAAGDFLYITLGIMESIRQEDGSFLVMERGSVLSMLNLRTGKQQEIAQYQNTFIQLLGAREDTLLFYTQDTLPSEEIGKPDYYEKTESLPARLQVWSEQSGCVILFEKANKDCYWIEGLQGGKLHYYSKEKSYAYDLITGECAETGLPLASSIVSEDFFFAAPGNLENREFGRFLDAGTGQNIVSKFDDANLLVRKKSSVGCIVTILYYRDPILNNDGTANISRKIDAYVTFESMKDGLQKEDILIIYEEEY
jgi:predicted small lipoprotein YifL